MNKTLKIFFLCSLGLLLQCRKTDINFDTPQIVESNDSVKVIKLAENKAVVFRSDFTILDSAYKIPKPFAFADYYVPKNAVVFDPTIGNVIEFDKAIDSHIKELQKKAKTLSWEDTTSKNQRTLHEARASRMNTKGLLKQFWGYVVSETDTIMEATYFQTYSGERDVLTRNVLGIWKKKPVVIHDGGPDYFRAEYNLSRDSLISFMVNGY